MRQLGEAIAGASGPASTIEMGLVEEAIELGMTRGAFVLFQHRPGEPISRLLLIAQLRVRCGEEDVVEDVASITEAAWRG